MKLNIVGPILGNTSGYVSHTRNLFNALAEEITDIHLETQLPSNWMAQVNDAELRAIKAPWHEDGVTIMIGTPPYWNIGKNNKSKAFYGYVVWEGDKIPKHWVPHIWKAKGIIVPSQHVKDAILNTIKEVAELDKPINGWEIYNIDMEFIHIIPHGVNTSLFVPQEKPPGASFTFVCNKGWANGIDDRGGLQYAFLAFSQEFRKHENVLLRVKVNTAYCPPGWDLSQELAKLNLPSDRPEFQICLNELEPKLLPQLYQGDCFLSPTMAEAFSIPCLEAMSCELPVITTDFGGQTDYCDEQTGWIIPTQRFEITHDWQYEGISWGRPDIPSLRKAMRYAFEHPDECKHKGRRARTKATYYTWRESALLLLKIIQEGATV